MWMSVLALLACVTASDAWLSEEDSHSLYLGRRIVSIMHTAGTNILVLHPTLTFKRTLNSFSMVVFEKNILLRKF